RYGRLIFPFNFFPELDFSIFESLEQFAAVIRRDFEEKAPSETDIVARLEGGLHRRRYELLRALALNLFWVNRYARTIYDQRPPPTPATSPTTPSRTTPTTRATATRTSSSASTACPSWRRSRGRRWSSTTSTAGTAGRPASPRSASSPPTTSWSSSTRAPRRCSSSSGA